LRSYERLERKWFETERNNTFFQRMRIGRFHLRRLTVALAPHPSPLPRESLPRAMSPVNRAAPVAAILPNNGAEHLLVIASLH
jgi:hypothetical protein